MLRFHCLLHKGTKATIYCEGTFEVMSNRTNNLLVIRSRLFRFKNFTTQWLSVTDAIHNIDEMKMCGLNNWPLYIMAVRLLVNVYKPVFPSLQTQVRYKNKTKNEDYSHVSAEGGRVSVKCMQFITESTAD